MFRWLARANGSMICLGQPEPGQPLVNVILRSGSSTCGILSGVAIFTPACERLLLSRTVLRQVQSSLAHAASLSLGRSRFHPQISTDLFWNSTEVFCHLPFAAALV